MFTRKPLRAAIVCAVAAVGGLLLVGAAVSDERAERILPTRPLPAERTGRYLTHLSTDKPIYRIGERVYIRGVLLDAHDHTPLPDDLSGIGALLKTSPPAPGRPDPANPDPANPSDDAGGRPIVFSTDDDDLADPRIGADPAAAALPVVAMVEIKGPRGERVAGGAVAIENSTLAFAWEVPPGQPGGQYTVTTSYPGDGYPPAKRNFDVRAYRAPRLKHQIVFLRDGYGPGDVVTASAQVERAEGGVPADAPVSVIARVDGHEIHRAETTVDRNGHCSARFTLPDKIQRGEGTLALVITDGGVAETATKTIPILLQTVDLAIYPESGDLIAGLPTRVYLQARTPAQKPADIAGTVVDDAGNTVATFRTAHEGRGRFAFTPRADQRYTLHITEPAGIRTTYPLPTTKQAGAVLRAVDDVTAAGEAVRLRVASTYGEPVKITLAARDKQLATATVQPAPGELADVVLSPPDWAEGVLVATAWGPHNIPLAERLVFRHPLHRVQVSIDADQPRYTPAGKVHVTVKTTDEDGRPVAAVVGLAAADDSVLEMIETREQAPRLPVMVLLESDTRDLADAHVYLDNENPNAPQAVDLLLGAQGWRRFAFVTPEEFLSKYNDDGDAARILAYRDPHRRQFGFAFSGPMRGRGGVDDFAVPLAFGVEDAKLRRGVAVDGDEVQLEVVERLGAPVEAAVPAAVAVPVESPALNEPAAARQQVAEREMAQEELADDWRPELQRAARRKIAADMAASVTFIPPSGDLFVIREYAHAARPDRTPGDRRDFTETLFWHAGVATNPTTGQATVSFDLSDAVTSFRIFADAFDAAGRLGAAATLIESVEPFYIEPKLPLAVTAGDVVRLPVAVVSALTGQSATATLAIETPDGIAAQTVAPFDLPADARIRKLLELNIGQFTGSADIVLTAEAQTLGDRVTRTLLIEPRGFPRAISFGGMIAPNSTMVHDVEIPQSFVAGSARAHVAVYPTPLANMTEALERLIRDPHGCFEQTSSTTYPLVMAQQYFLTHTGVDPALIRRSGEKLDAGYARLAGFECKQKGYEWFGADPGHEALTAFGLMEFTDMAQVRNVDADMLRRTRAWLMNTRDGEGGFTRGRRALHTWIEDKACSNAYILWALLESGGAGLEREVAWVKKNAQDNPNSYVTALAANAMSLAGDHAAARELMDTLRSKQAESGAVGGATASIVGSRGDALEIETTALATLAWLRDPTFAGAVEKAVKYLAESCEGGRYGSTQSTVLALRAIVEYDKSRARPKAAGRVAVLVDGKQIGDAVPFDPDSQEAIELPDIGAALTPGAHEVVLKMVDGAAMPYSIAVEYHDETPSADPDCAVDLAVALRNAELAEGEITEAVVTVANRRNEALPMTVAIIGLPGGCEPRHDQLKELVKAERVDAYEVRGRDVVFYWRSFNPNQQREIPLTLVAAVPGTYTGPASRAYEYYADESKDWEPPMKVTIAPQE